MPKARLASSSWMISSMNWRTREKLVKELAAATEEAAEDFQEKIAKLKAQFNQTTPRSPFASIFLRVNSLNHLLSRTRYLRQGLGLMTATLSGSLKNMADMDPETRGNGVHCKGSQAPIAAASLSGCRAAPRCPAGGRTFFDTWRLCMADGLGLCARLVPRLVAGG